MSKSCVKNRAEIFLFFRAKSYCHSSALLYAGFWEGFTTYLVIIFFMWKQSLAYCLILTTRSQDINMKMFDVLRINILILNHVIWLPPGHKSLFFLISLNSDFFHIIFLFFNLEIICTTKSKWSIQLKSQGDFFWWFYLLNYWIDDNFFCKKFFQVIYSITIA